MAFTEGIFALWTCYTVQQILSKKNYLFLATSQNNSGKKLDIILKPYDVALKIRRETRRGIILAFATLTYRYALQY